MHFPRRPPDPGCARNDRGLVPRVLVLNFDPIVETEGKRRLHEVLGWPDPRILAGGYVSDVRACSKGYVRYDLVDWKDLDVHPVKKDGFRYTDAGYLDAWRGGRGFHQPDAIDYRAILKSYDIPRRIDKGEIDEVWLFGYPYSGMWESVMAGPSAYYCNADPLTGVATRRNFVIMGFSYERGVGEMLEDLGHRAESILKHVYGSWDPADPKHLWDKFTAHEKVAPGRAGVGTMHFAPNSRSDYDWGNRTLVDSSADDWLDFPKLTGARRRMNCSDWGNGDIRSHHRWWLDRLPAAAGRGPDGKLASWWSYVIDFNRYSESAK